VLRSARRTRRLGAHAPFVKGIAQAARTRGVRRAPDARTRSGPRRDGCASVPRQVRRQATGKASAQAKATKPEARRAAPRTTPSRQGPKPSSSKQSNVKRTSSRQEEANRPPCCGPQRSGVGGLLSRGRANLSNETEPACPRSAAAEEYSPFARGFAGDGAGARLRCRASVS
jgi:hypothetical protein